MLDAQGKLARYGVLVKHLVAWGFHPTALSHRRHVSPVLSGRHVCTQKTLNDHGGNLSHGTLVSGCPASFEGHLWDIMLLVTSNRAGISNVLSSRLFVVSARIPCTMGKENFPSERSSAKPLFAEY